MAVTGIDHLYAETTRWDGSPAFWSSLGCEIAGEWGTRMSRVFDPDGRTHALGAP